MRRFSRKDTVGSNSNIASKMDVDRVSYASRRALSGEFQGLDENSLRRVTQQF